ncbi:hypothetical protein FL857_12185 [Criibacterium bergeronii]|uniref:Toxin YqcG C-terminal domain-containing protein n=2 Tax=Criibacterium bergeronii TaxID=1871336 RepID=A0A552US60_9FIRM|nr:hypothetical protein FL857_12185 [Criibacterium bergeronii]
MIRDFFVSMVTAGVLDGVARKIGSTQVYKVVKEKVGKTTKELGERLDRKVKEILEPVLDTFKPRQELVTPEGIVFSTRNIDNTIENKSMLSRVKNIVTGTGEESVEKVGKESKALANNTYDEISKGANKAVSYDRPSHFRKGVRDSVWDDAKNVNGDVIDPVTGEVMDKAQPWHMGHKPGFEFRKHQQSAIDRGISRKQFLDEHNKSEHYRPELPKSNQSHKGEDITDNYFGD